MIFGKTKQDKYLADQARIAQMRDGYRRFLFLGKLENGQWVMLQSVWTYHDVVMDKNGDLSLSAWAPGTYESPAEARNYIHKNNYNISVRKRA
jgi:hypothetical protein